MPKKVIKTIKIENCLDCPHSKKITSPYTGDSFDMSDEDLVCTLSPSQVKGQHETIKGKVIWPSERWWKREHGTIPKWCPL